MKNRVVVPFALVVCLFSVAFMQPAWAADPGTRYSDAFVLIQQGQAAEETELEEAEPHWLWIPQLHRPEVRNHDHDGRRIQLGRPDSDFEV